MTESERPSGEGSELEGGGTDQTWGQGEGQHEPTIPEPDDQADTEDAPPASYADGTARQLDDPDLPLAREDEGMDR
jgi:hypothetical protein